MLAKQGMYRKAVKNNEHAQRGRNSGCRCPVNFRPLLAENTCQVTGNYKKKGTETWHTEQMPSTKIVDLGNDQIATRLHRTDVEVHKQDGAAFSIDLLDVAHALGHEAGGAHSQGLAMMRMP